MRNLTCRPSLPITAAAFAAVRSSTHAHMQALPANQRFMEAFDIRPVIMIRNILDMLASYWDMLESDPAARRDGLNCKIPENFPSLTQQQKADFLIDILAPWYASYYSTWLGYTKAQPDRVLVLRYAELQADQAGTLDRLLEHSRLPRLRKECEVAIKSASSDRKHLRFNQGTEGRGLRYFSLEHVRASSRGCCGTIRISAPTRTSCCSRHSRLALTRFSPAGAKKKSQHKACARVMLHHAHTRFPCRRLPPRRLRVCLGLRLGRAFRRRQQGLCREGECFAADRCSGVRPRAGL